MFVYFLYYVLYLLPIFKVKALHIIDMKVIVDPFFSPLYQAIFIITFCHNIAFFKLCISFIINVIGTYNI